MGAFHRYRRSYLKFSSYDTGISSGGPQSYPKRVEDKRQLCHPLEAPVSFEENLN